MVIKNSSFENDIKIEKYGKHVSVNMGTQYAVVSCTKHHLSDFVKVVDELSMKGWVITSGLTSEDGRSFKLCLNHQPITITLIEQREFSYDNITSCSCWIRKYRKA